MDPRARWTEVEGRPTRYCAEGEGRPVVLVHGLGLSGAFWADHFPAFSAAGFRVFAPDLPGCGGTPGPLSGQSVAETAAWLLSFADAIGLPHAAWLGHSLAAQAALELAVRAPARVDALVLASPTGAPARWTVLRQLLGYLRDIGREPLRLIPMVAREYLRASPTAFIGSWLKASRDRPVAKMRDVRCPTLIVRGRDDPIVSRDDVMLLRRHMPGARVATLPGGAHGVVFGCRAAFDRITTSFLREATASSAA